MRLCSGTRSASPSVMFAAAESEAGPGAEGQRIAVVQRRVHARRQFLAVEERAVGRAQVADEDAVRSAQEQGVTTRDPGVAADGDLHADLGAGPAHEVLAV